MLSESIKKLYTFSAKLFAAVLLTLLFACDQAPTPKALRLSANAWIGYEPLFVAESQGFFEAGSVHLIETPFSWTLEQALRGGTIDASTVSLSHAFTLASDGYDITIILVLDWSNGADRIMASPEITSIDDLKGKRVGSEDRSVNKFLLLRAIQKSSLQLDDITLIPIINENLDEAYASGDIVAASVFGPTAVELKRLGAKVIFDSSVIPGEIIDTIIVRTPYLEKHPERVEQMIAGWIKAVDYIEALPEGAKRPRGLLNDQNFKDAIDGIRFAGRQDNQSFFENDAKRLKAVLEARQRLYASLKQSSTVHKIPKIDPRPFFRAVERAHQ